MTTSSEGIPAVNLSDIDLRQAAREHLIAAGADPDAGHQRSTFNLAEHMLTCSMKLLAAHIPPVFHDVEPTHPDVLAWIDRFLVNPQESPNLFLRGPTGSGKTLHAYGALRKLAIAMAGQSRRFYWQVTTFADFNAAMRPRGDGGHEGNLAELQRTGLLILDDLGAGVTSNWTDDNLHRLVDYRWSHRLPSIVTTNLTSEKLVATFDERVVSRLRNSVQIAFAGPDRRRPL